jgi:uncharacterized Tic20 family protein
MENEHQTPETTTPGPERSSGDEERQAHTIGMLCHLSSLILYLGIPFGNVLGPLIFWLVKKDSSEFVDDQGKESLNFQITVSLAMIASGILCIILVGLPLLFLILIVNFVMTIIGAVAASKGERYRYPFVIRLLR